MTGMWNRKRARSERSERWQREDAAPRLAVEVPGLASLSLVLRDCAEDTALRSKSRTQHVIVERAAALFEVACTERKCENGGFDLTKDVLAALRRRETSAEGVAQCNGTVGQGYCRCTLEYVVRATYTDVAT